LSGEKTCAINQYLDKLIEARKKETKKLMQILSFVFNILTRENVPENITIKTYAVILLTMQGNKPF
jgi:hypothetical protein